MVPSGVREKSKVKNQKSKIINVIPAKAGIQPGGKGGGHCECIRRRRSRSNLMVRQAHHERFSNPAHPELVEGLLAMTNSFDF